MGVDALQSLDLIVKIDDGLILFLVHLDERRPVLLQALEVVLLVMQLLLFTVQLVTHTGILVNQLLQHQIVFGGVLD